LRSLDDTEAANGFGNRFLWACVQRSKILPEGGRIQEVDFLPLISRLRQSIAWARTTGELSRDDAARAIWCDIYPDLSEGKPGLYGAMIARAEAHVMRLACIYALLDQSNLVRKEHLLAAIAVWEYCEASCRYLLGHKLGDPIADVILEALRQTPEGLTRADIHSLFKRHAKAGQLDTALSLLQRVGAARKEERKSGGRPAEVWFAT